MSYNLAGDRLLIPADHGIARYRRYWSGYGENLTRIARAVHSKYPNMTAVDVGANVGDSALLLRQGAPVPVLCVEGDPRFAGLLRHNLADTPGVEIEEAFVGAEPGAKMMRARSAGGSAWLMPDGSGSPTRFVTLGFLLESHPSFASPRLIKIDTDGFDCDIISASRKVLEEARPTLMFEYAPDMYREPGRAFEIFEVLTGAGYTGVIAYLNHGEYLCSAELSDRRLLEDLHAHVSGHAPYGQASPRYFDLCAFHAEDEDVRSALRDTELRLERVPGLQPRG